MFAGKATFRAVDCVQNIAQVRLVHSNDNLVHRMAGAPRAPALVCHWHIAPATGKPECHWEARHATAIKVASKSRGPALIGSMRCVHAAREDLMTLFTDAPRSKSFDCSSTKLAISASLHPRHAENQKHAHSVLYRRYLASATARE